MLKIQPRNHGDVTILDIAGKITIGRGDVELRNAIDTVLAAGRCNLLLNLEKVKRIDSSGVGEIVAASNHVANHGGQLKLLKLSAKVSDVLQTTQIMSVVEVHDDEAEALSSFETRLAAVG